MRNLASTTPVGSITERPSEKPLAPVGKPYTLPGWSAVCGNLLALRRTLCCPENRLDSAWNCLTLFARNRRTRHEYAPAAREVPHF
jgi:hypothetical protein